MNQSQQTDNPVNQTQQTQAIQKTIHNTHRKSNETITTNTDNPVNQTELKANTCSYRHARKTQVPLASHDWFCRVEKVARDLFRHHRI